MFPIGPIQYPLLSGGNGDLFYGAKPEKSDSRHLWIFDVFGLLYMHFCSSSVVCWWDPNQGRCKLSICYLRPWII